jgi:hypothetical protein
MEDQLNELVKQKSNLGGQHRSSVGTDTRHALTDAERQEELRRRWLDFERERRELAITKGPPF